ncbi:MAG TPA: tetratricopeptide repeat protein [Rhodocyclaceae bacterium]|nr:tetratricopeptide repeat protein [Rhodocyclaceae bacterium]
MFGLFRKKPNVDTSIADARTLVASGNLQGALTIYDGLVRAYPESAEAHADRGTALAMSGNTTAAIADLKKAISLGYNHSSVYASLATAQMQEGDVQGAIANFGAAAALDQENALIYYNRANLFAKLGDHEAARRDLECCLRLGPDANFETAIRGKLSALPTVS